MLTELWTIIIISAGLISTGIIWYGYWKKKRKLNIAGFLLLLVTIFAFFEFFPEHAPKFSAWATVAIAIAAFAAIEENRRLREENSRIREEERERDSKRRRLEEMQDWINKVLRIKSECNTTIGEPFEWRQRAVAAKVTVANKKYIEIEAERIDSEFPAEIKLKDKIGRLSHILEHQDARSLSNEQTQQELEDNCIEALKVIANIKAELKL